MPTNYEYLWVYIRLKISQISLCLSILGLINRKANEWNRKKVLEQDNNYELFGRTQIFLLFIP